MRAWKKEEVGICSRNFDSTNVFATRKLDPTAAVARKYPTEIIKKVNCRANLRNNEP